MPRRAYRAICRPHERAEAQRRASLPLSFTAAAAKADGGRSSARREPVPSDRKTTPTRALPHRRGSLLLLYAGAYVAFRQSHAEVWDRDKRTYIIYPETYGRPVYYLWRPLSYLDTAITGMQHHIGPHR